MHKISFFISALAITLAISPVMAVIEQQSITTEISKDGQQELDLAQSLLKKHKNAQAYNLAKKVYVTQGERSLTWPQLVTVAQCAEAVGDSPKEAARPLGKYFPVNLMEVGREKEAVEFAWGER